MIYCRAQTTWFALFVCGYLVAVSGVEVFFFYRAGVVWLLRTRQVIPVGEEKVGDVGAVGLNDHYIGFRVLRFLLPQRQEVISAARYHARIQKLNVGETFGQQSGSNEFVIKKRRVYLRTAKEKNMLFRLRKLQVMVHSQALGVGHHFVGHVLAAIQYLFC